MTPEAQRVAIAAVCGWRIKQVKVSGMLDVLLVPPGWPKDAMAYTGDLPDYLNDLNAMHEAEKVLDDVQISAYSRSLCIVCRRDCPIEMPVLWMTLWDYYHATASQRAEAFLRTIGKWTE